MNKGIILTGSNAVANMIAMISNTENIHDDVLGDLITYEGMTYWSNFNDIHSYNTAAYIWNSEFSYQWTNYDENTMKTYWLSNDYSGNCMDFALNTTNDMTYIVTVEAAEPGYISLTINGREYASLKAYLNAGDTHTFTTPHNMVLTADDTCKLYGTNILNKIDFTYAEPVYAPSITYAVNGSFTYMDGETLCYYEADNAYNILAMSYGHASFDAIRDLINTTEAPTTDTPVTDVPTTYAPVTEEPTTSEPTTYAPVTEAPTTAEPTTAPTTAPTEEPALTYWTTGITELSGMTFLGDTLYAVSDRGSLYTVTLPSDSQTAECTKVKDFGSYDIEGITNDGTNLYIAVEGLQKVYKVDVANGYSLTEIIALDSVIKAIDTEETEYSASENGLEGIAFWNHNNGIIFAFNQDHPAGYVAIENGTAHNSDKLSHKKYDIGEVADACIDGDTIYVVDSDNGLCIKTTIKVTGSGNYKLENYEKVSWYRGYDTTKGGHLENTTVEADGVNRIYLPIAPGATYANENIEALTVHGDYLYYGCDSNTKRIYRIRKF